MVPEPKEGRYPNNPLVARTKAHFYQCPERLLEGSNLAASYSFLDPRDKFVKHVLYRSLGNESQVVTGF